MRVLEPKRDGDLGPVDQHLPGAVVVRHGRRLAEFDYPRDAVDYVQRCHDLGLRHLRIYNPAARR